MDPEACLKELRELMTEFNDESRIWDGTDGLLEALEKAQRVAELLAALDGWLSNGGTLPRRWATTQASKERPTMIQIGRCGSCPFVKKDFRGWSQGECEHPDALDVAPDGGNIQTYTLNNRPGWCPLLIKDARVVAEKRAAEGDRDG